MDIVAMGEPLVEFNSAAGEALDAATTFTSGFGGDTANFIVAAQRAGVNSGYITRIGDDAFGGRLLNLWRAEGVDTTHVVREPGGRTGIYFIARDARDSSFTYYRAGSPASRLSPADVPAQAIAEAHALHISGITQAISTSACDAAFHAMQIARANDTLVSYDPNYRGVLWPVDRARATVARSMELCDVALPNIEEARILTGLSDPGDIVQWFGSLGPQTVILKMGEHGALLWHDGRIREVPAHPVAAIDSTGAGDAFGGAFVALLVQGFEPYDAARYAAVAGALTTLGHGAVHPIPHREQVIAAMRSEQSTEVQLVEAS